VEEFVAARAFSGEPEGAERREKNRNYGHSSPESTRTCSEIFVKLYRLVVYAIGRVPILFSKQEQLVKT